MGTRHLTMVKLGDKVFGQYGQWDGYPSGQGEVVVEFLRTFNEDLFREQFKKSTFLTDEQREAALFKGKNPQLDRDCGANILRYIQDVIGTPVLYNSISFAGDSLFCEWGYMVDLDERKLRCFRGFNQKPLEDGQFFKTFPGLEARKSSVFKDYYPIREIKSYSFEELRALTDLTVGTIASDLDAIVYPNEDGE